MANERILQPLAEFFWPVRAYMEDTDAGGIVYYVNYLKFMERARTESLRGLGFGKEFIFEQQSMFVVHSLSVDYILPARLDDELLVEAHILQLKRTSVLFRQNICRGGEILCRAWVKIACIDKAYMRPVAMPEVMYTALKKIIQQRESLT